MSTAAPQRPAPASDIAARPAPADSALRRILSGNGTVTVLAILLSLLPWRDYSSRAPEFLDEAPIGAAK